MPFVITSDTAASHFKKVDYTLKTYNGLVSFIWRTLFFYIKIGSLIRSIKKANPDAVIYFPVFHPWNLLISQSAKRNSVQVISTVHDYKTHIGEGNMLLEWIQRKTMSLSDQIIFLTESERKKAQTTTKDLMEKSLVIPHPILPSGAYNNLEHSTQLKFLFLGRISRYKGIDLIIEAISKNPKLNITVAGQGLYDKKMPVSINYINRHLSDKEIKNLLESHHVLLLPYIDASQSGVLTLGTDAGIPMIISEIEGLQEQVDRKAAYWIEQNAESLSAAMNNLQSDAELYNEIRENLRANKKEKQKLFLFKLNQLIKLIDSPDIA